METSTGELRLYSTAADGCFNFRTSLSTFWFAQAVSVPSLINRSKELYKSNIVEYKNAWNIVKNSKIYEYNLKDELDNDIDQKHYGFIIERETPKEIIAGNGEGVDIYSISSLNWLATQELIQELENQKKEIEELKHMVYEFEK